MKRLVVIVLSALIAASCVQRDDVSLLGVSNVSMTSSGVDMTVSVENRAACKLRLQQCTLELSVRGRKAIGITIDKPVVIDAHFTGEVPVALQLQITDPIAGLAAIGAFNSTSESVNVSGEVVVRAGLQRKKIRFENEPLSKILSNFGAEKLLGT